MEIKEERAGDVLVLAPDGDLNAGEECHALEQRLGAALSSGARYLVVDCASVGHLTSAALRALLLTSRKLARLKGRLVLCGMTPKVQQAFAISGFDRDFTVVPARDEAVSRAQQAGTASASPKPSRGEEAAPVSATPPVPDVPAAVHPPVPAAAVPPPVAAAPAPPATVAPAAPVVATPPDSRPALAARLLAALASAPGQPAPAPPPASPAADRDALADALLRALAARPA